MAIRQYRFRRAVRTLAAVAAGGILFVILIKMLLPLVVVIGVGVLILMLIAYALRS